MIRGITHYALVLMTAASLVVSPVFAQTQEAQSQQGQAPAGQEQGAQSQPIPGVAGDIRDLAAPAVCERLKR